MALAQPLPKDPIQTRSMSWPIFIASGLLLASTALALFDEFFTRRPYKVFQEKFVVVYANYLERGLLPKQKTALKKIQALPEYVQKQKDIEAAQLVADANNAELDAKLAPVVQNVESIKETLKVAKADFDAWKYKWDAGKTEADKQAAMNEMERVKKGPYRVSQVAADGSPTPDRELTFDELRELNLALLADKAKYETAKGKAGEPVKELQAQLQHLVDSKLAGPHPDSVKKIIDAADARKVGAEKAPMGFNLPALPNGQILQIHLEDINWVDRCESCHVGVREPIDMTKEQLFAIEQNNFETPDDAVVFTSHPRRALLEVHDPERFGCSMCHNGNGRSVSDVQLAHGLNKHWLYKLYPRDNFEAGCVQCHKEDLVLNARGVEAPTLNQGKWLFYWKGCWGCHKYEGFDKEPELITAKQKQIEAVEVQHAELARQRDAAEETSAKQLLDQRMSGLETTANALLDDLHSLKTSAQKVGPSLRNVRVKDNPDWLVQWIENPRAFKPRTKMPKYDFQPGDAEKIAAYIWQNGDAPAPTKHPQGDAKNGKWLFEQRGCMACHTLTVNGAAIGDGFATDLTRIGDKSNYDYIVEWILNPTNGVMPSLRLTEQESCDLTTYLFSLRTGEVFPAQTRLADPLLARNPQLDVLKGELDGERLIRNFGCAGCHDIKGMEAEGRIGTELTAEGSKPLERLDFGRQEHDFKTAGKYLHKYFFETKIQHPKAFGEGKYYENPRDDLKMPDFGLKDDEVTALTTFIMGSVDSELPRIEANAMRETFAYNPDERGQAVREGWWIVKKYNCVGCHQFETGETPHLWSLPQYNGPGVNAVTNMAIADLSVRRPPSLVGQGFRSDPNWLAKFLRNPALVHDAADMHRNGVRNYLDVRMPTFRLSDLEIQKLVRFFGALASQPAQYARAEYAPLAAEEVAMGRSLFKTLQCITCHATGEPEWDREKANAPRLQIVNERLNPPWTIRWIQNPAHMIPGTAMPQNFSEEVSVKLMDGTTVIGTKYEANPVTGKASLKVNGENRTIDLMQIDGKPVVRRWVANTVPDGFTYAGDHIELVARYLGLYYDDAETQLVKPDAPK
jgi:cytochrome c2